MKMQLGKVHIRRTPIQSMVNDETFCGLIIEQFDELGDYDSTDKVVYYRKTKNQVPEDLVCLSCLRIAGPCFYEFIRDEYKPKESSNEVIPAPKDIVIPNQVIENFNPRRPLDDDMPDGYQESDSDYVINNHEVCIWFLEQLESLQSNK